MARSAKTCVPIQDRDGKTGSRARLDIAVAARGLARSRTAAQNLIDAGRISVNGAPETRSRRQVGLNDLIEVTGTSEADRYVSRGGVKLAAALDAWAVDATGLRALDVGASTGGFTDCLLQRGAASVVAIDVGHGQLDPRIASDPRVDSREGLSARDITPGTLGDPFDLIVIDISFISLTLVLGIAPSLLAPTGSIIALVKPQFEVGRESLGKGGIVKSDTLRQAAVDRILSAGAEAGLACHGRIESPIAGGDGNIEYLVLLRRSIA